MRAHLNSLGMAERDKFERFGRWRALDPRPQHTSRMSSIWRVRDDGDPARVVRALKIMKHPKAPTSSAYVRFLREVKALSQLAGRHQAIMPLVDRGEVTGEGGGRRVFLVMPYYATSLDKAARGLAGNVEYALAKLIVVAQALEAAHAERIIHRDVKPQNVLLDGDEQRVVLGDFGICLLGEDERFTHTENGTLGTPHFVAPELLGGGRIEDVRPTADVYSLGKTLYAVLAGGNEVYPGSRHRDARYDLVRRFGDPRLAHVHGALDLLSAEDPAERPQTMAEARALLERIREAIRENVTYREGLYRSGPTAEWRALRLSNALGRTTPDSTARRDAVREALETIAAEVETLARESSTPVGVAAPPGPELTLAADFLRAVDEVLGGVLPLLKAADEGLQDAQAVLIRWLDADPEQSRADAFLQSVASVSIHLLAATAWRWQRGATLGWCIEQLAGRYRYLVYLRAFEGWSNRSARAVVQALRDSLVISRLAPEVRDTPRASVDTTGNADEPPTALLCVTGLIAMRGVWFYPDSRPSATLAVGDAQSFGDWPAFQHEYRTWIEVLPDQLLRSARWEQDVAAMAFGTDFRTLRRHWAENARVLADIFAFAYSSRNRDVSAWLRGDLSQEWIDWAGKA